MKKRSQNNNNNNNNEANDVVADVCDDEKKKQNWKKLATKWSIFWVKCKIPISENFSIQNVYSSEIYKRHTLNISLNEPTLNGYTQ